MSGLSLDQTVNPMLGPAGSAVKLTILDLETGHTRNITVIGVRVTLRKVTCAVAGYERGPSVHRDLQQRAHQGTSGDALQYSRCPTVARPRSAPPTA